MSNSRHPDPKTRAPQGASTREQDARGASLKPGDVVYGPCPTERNGVLARHWGVVLDSKPGEVLLVYTTSEKDARAASQMTFSQKDMDLSGMKKAGHWAADSVYVVPGEVLEKRGRVSDETFAKMAEAVQKRASSPQSTALHMDDTGRVTNLKTGKVIEQWKGYEKAKDDAASGFRSPVPSREGHGDSHRGGRWGGGFSTYEAGAAAAVVGAMTVNRLADGRGVDTQIAEAYRTLEKSPVTYPFEKASEAMDALGDSWRKQTGLPTVGDLADRAVDAALKTPLGQGVVNQVDRIEQWLNEKNRPQQPEPFDGKGGVLSQAHPETSAVEALAQTRVNQLVGAMAQAMDADHMKLDGQQCKDLSASLQCAPASAVLALSPDGRLRVTPEEELSRLPEGSATVTVASARQMLKLESRELPRGSSNAADESSREQPSSEMVMKA
jgi:hypothetical protein